MIPVKKLTANIKVNDERLNALYHRRTILQQNKNNKIIQKKLKKIKQKTAKYYLKKLKKIKYIQTSHFHEYPMFIIGWQYRNRPTQAMQSL